MTTMHSVVPGATKLPVRLLASFWDSWRAGAKGWSDYWSSAMRRGATPFDLWLEGLKWLEVSQRRDQPQWATENRIVFETPVARLRDFSLPDGKDPGDLVPTLLLPPQAGHDSCIVDFSPDQSQLRAVREGGLTSVFSMDWIGATAATKDAGIDDYLEALERAVDHLGGKVNLVGDCQGGWLAVIYAAMYPEQINTLTIAGAPIDYHLGEPLIHDWMKVMPEDFYAKAVKLGDGVLRGEFMLAGFRMMKPDGEIDRQLQLLANITDDVHVRRYRQFETWFQHTQDVSGAFYLWIVEHLFRNNELIRGELEIRGRRLDLRDITCPLFLLAGKEDHITPPSQVFALADYAGTPADQVVRRTTTGGHLGLFMGREALVEYWPPIIDEVRKLSVAPAVRASG
jgi:poly(3-hydroxybutyrate) depolymerase